MSVDEFYRQSVDEVLAAFRTTRQDGLSPEEVERRLHKYGKNELQSQPPTPLWRRFLAQFQDVLVILLLIASAISAALWLY